MGLNLFAQITKVDEAKRLVTGRAVQEVPDRADEIFDYATSRPYFEAWSKSFADDTDGKSLGNVRAMHGKVAAGKVTALDFNDGDKAIDISAKIVDDGEWNKVLEGVYTGFSIGGSYVGERKAEKMGDKEIKRYTANPAEISIVDAPCVPTAKFFQIHKADGTDAQVEFKTAPEANPEPVKKATEPMEVKGSDAQVAQFAEFLNAEGLRMTDVLERLAEAAMLDSIEEMGKREFSADERKAAAKSGHALPDGSFPINSVGDLKNAIKAYGRAKDKAKAKAHIISRAKALGESKLLPESWTNGGESEKFTAADEELIKAALAKPLIESDSQEAFSSNVAAEIKAGKPKEQAVAIAYAVQRKAKSKKADRGTLHKGMWNVSRFVECLVCLADITRAAEYDLQAEGDDSAVPMKMRNALEEMIECFKEMADEESAEMLAELKEHADVGEDDEIEEAMEASMRAGALLKRLNDPEMPVIALAKLAEEQLTEAERQPLKSIEDVRKAIMAKASSMTQAHKDKIQAVHDHAADMGAECRTEKEAAASAQELLKVTEQLSEMQKRLDELASQPAPHVVLRTISKAEETKGNGAADNAWVTRVPMEKLIKHQDGSINWQESARRLSPADAI
jgi:hypothetical protein